MYFIVGAIRSTYPKGTLVELVSMDDPHSKLKPGDRGSGPGVVYGEDEIRIVTTD